MDMTTDAGPDYGNHGLRWQSSALLALQEASEAFLVHLFEDAYVFAVLLNRYKYACYGYSGIFVLSMRNE